MPKFVCITKCYCENRIFKPGETVDRDDYPAGMKNTWRKLRPAGRILSDIVKESKEVEKVLVEEAKFEEVESPIDVDVPDFEDD